MHIRRHWQADICVSTSDHHDLVGTPQEKPELHFRKCEYMSLPAEDTVLVRRLRDTGQLAHASRLKVFWLARASQESFATHDIWLP